MTTTIKHRTVCLALSMALSPALLVTPAKAHTGDSISVVCGDDDITYHRINSTSSISFACNSDGLTRIRFFSDVKIERAELFLDPDHGRQLDRPMHFVWNGGRTVQVMQEQHVGIASAQETVDGVEWILALPSIDHRTVGFGMSLVTQSGEATWPATDSKNLNRRRLGDLLLLPRGQQSARASGNVDWAGGRAMTLPKRIVAISTNARVEGPVRDDGHFELELVPGTYRLFPLDSRMPAYARDSIPFSAGSGEQLEIEPPLTANVAQGPMEELVPAILKSANVKAAAIAIVRDGVPVYSGTFGIEADGDPAGPLTLFGLESITKTVTAMTLISLAEQGALDLDERLAVNWVDPDVQDDPRNQELTYRMVLRHLAALPNWRGDGALQFLGDPGAKQQYSGEGFEYARRAVERKFRRSLQSLGQEYVFGPAGTRNMSYLWPEDGDARAAGVHYGDFAFGDSKSETKANAATDLSATANDLVKYAAWLANGASLSTSTWHRVLTPNRTEFLESDDATPLGEGLFIFDFGQFGRLPIFGHGGSGMGSKSMLVVDLEGRNAVAIATSSGSGLAVIRAVLEAAFKQGIDYPCLERELMLSEKNDY